MRSFTSLFCLLPLISGAPQYLQLGYANTYNTGAYHRFYTGYKAYPYNVYNTPAQLTSYPFTRNIPTAAVAPVININGGDIIGQTRNLAESVKTTLRSLAADPQSSVIVSRIINDQNNVCIRNLDDGLNAIEEATRLVEAAGNDINALISKVQSFSRQTNPSTVVREVAAILRILEPLVKNIAPAKPLICAATPDQALGSLRNLAVLVDELAYTHQLALTPEGRGQLKQSANVISAVTSFVTKLRAKFSRFQQICTGDRQYNIEAMGAVGDLMVDLADLFGSLGGVQKGEDIRRGREFVGKVVVSF